MSMKPMVGVSDKYLMQTIRASAEEAGVSPETLRAMDVKVQQQYNMGVDAYEILISWGDPSGKSKIRRTVSYSYRYDREHGAGVADAELRRIVDRIDFRSELGYLKLYSRFRERLTGVEITRVGQARVVFSNGRELFTAEKQLESIEFLATCCMVYDL